jgi:transcriptional regulator with XRE-family HTH domain
MSFEVDGRKLRARRQELSRLDKTEESWSQEAVALRAGIDRVTYGNMERVTGQRFSLTVINYACTALNISSDEIILTPDIEDVQLIGPTKVDFRPVRPWSAPEWEESRVAAGLDKLGFMLRTNVALQYRLDAISLTMPELSGNEVFKCRYLSTFAPGANGHLGIETEFHPQDIQQRAPVKERGWTFLSDGDVGCSWSELHDVVAVFPKNVLQVQVLLNFDRFQIQKTLYLSRAQAQSYMKEVRRLNQPYLKFMQLEVLKL